MSGRRAATRGRTVGRCDVRSANTCCRGASCGTRQDRRDAAIGLWPTGRVRSKPCGLKSNHRWIAIIEVVAHHNRIVSKPSGQGCRRGRAPEPDVGQPKSSPLAAAIAACIMWYFPPHHSGREDVAQSVPVQGLKTPPRHKCLPAARLYLESAGASARAPQRCRREARST